MQKAIAPGTVIERRYQIQKKTTDNTFNCCYLAEDAAQSNRLVVLSFPRIELLILPGFASAFKDACDNLANARLSGLVKVLGSGLYESQPYAVLPNITDESLRTSFQHNVSTNQKVTVESVLDWAAPLAVSLDDLHDADYIHSNIRPGSIYVSSNKLLLGDFITEFALQRMGKFKSAISTLDVSDYLAPEYLKSFYTASYDQYLLATLIYEALVREPPFAQVRSGDAYRMHVATKIAEPLSKFRPDLTGISDVLVKALDRNPSNRFTSCRELISQLQEAQVVEQDARKIVALKPALKEVTPPVVEALPAEPMIASIRNEEGAGKGKKGLMWLSVLLLGSVAVAYTVVSQNGADQITSSSTRAKSASDDSAVSVKVAAETKLVQALPSELPKPEIKALEHSVSVKGNEQALDSVTSNLSEKVTTTNSGQLKSLIEKEALLAHQAIAQSNVTLIQETTVKASEAAVVASNKAPLVNDFSGLTSVINQAVNAGQKDFLESKKNDADSKSVASDVGTPIDVVAITDQVVAANDEVPTTDTGLIGEDSPVESSEELEAKLQAQERLNQELLAVQALVNSREAQARAANEKATADKVATQASNTVGQSPQSQENTDRENLQENQAGVGSSAPLIAVGQQAQSTQIEEVVDSNRSATVGSGASAAERQIQLTERQRILAFKQKELARIKGITDDCTIGGKIHREAAAGNLSFVKACMAVGVNPNLAQSNRWTLLHIAARSGHLNMSKLLIAKGARVNARASDGQTPLDMAIAQRKTKVVTYLKTRGGVATR